VVVEVARLVRSLQLPLSATNPSLERATRTVRSVNSLAQGSTVDANLDDPLVLSGATGALSVALDLHGESSADLASSVCATLRLVSFRGTVAKTVLVYADAPSALVKVARAHAASAPIVADVCATLGNIAIWCEHRKDAVVTSGAIPLVVNALRAHHANAVVCAAASETLQILVSASSEQHRNLAVQSGALAQLVAAISEHRHQYIVQHATQALFYLVSESKSRSDALVAEPGAVAALRALLRDGGGRRAFQGFPAEVIEAIMGRKDAIRSCTII